MGEKEMNTKAIFVLLICIFAVCLVLLSLQTTIGGDWNEISQNVALISAVLVLFAIVIAAIIEVRR
jgi:hypothetical protein